MRQPDLDFDTARDQDREIAEHRRAAGMARVEASAARRDPDFEERALEAVRVYAEQHASFLAEQVRATCATPDTIDGRVWGPIFTRAQKRGWIEPAGFAPANSSNRSPKVNWRSLIWKGAA